MILALRVGSGGISGLVCMVALRDEQVILTMSIVYVVADLTDLTPLNVS